MAIAASVNPVKLVHSISNIPSRSIPKDALPSNNSLPVINRDFTRASGSNRKQRRARK